MDLAREKAWWDAKASREEDIRGDGIINRALRWREIERHLDGVETILEIGAATGIFSIPLARRGFQVTHLDLSPEMLRLARESAGGSESICFVEGNVLDLPFADRSFDLVLNMDGAVSFCGSAATRAVEETCRVTTGKVVITVSNRAAMVATWLESVIETTGQIQRAAYSMLERGIWDQNEYPENHLLAKSNTGGYIPAFRAFLPGELRALLESRGMAIIRLGGLGSLAKLCGKRTVDRVMADESLLGEFVDVCERYDLEILPDGPGTEERAGLIAVAERIESKTN